MLLIGYFSSYYITFYQDGNRFVELLQKSSPAAWYIGAVSEPEKAGSMALWAVAVTVLLIALCVFLYKKRPSEAAGRAMAFRKSQPVIKLLLVVPIALTGSLISVSYTHLLQFRGRRQTGPYRYHPGQQKRKPPSRYTGTHTKRPKAYPD